MGHTHVGRPIEHRQLTGAAPSVGRRLRALSVCLLFAPLQLGATRTGAPEPISGAFGVRFGTPVSAAVVLTPIASPAVPLPSGIAVREPALRAAIPVRWRKLRPPTVPPLLKDRPNPATFAALLDDANAPVRIVASVPATDCSLLFKRVNSVLEERYATTPLDLPPIQVIAPPPLLTPLLTPRPTTSQAASALSATREDHATPKIMLPGLHAGATANAVATPAVVTISTKAATAQMTAAGLAPSAATSVTPGTTGAARRYASIGPSKALAAALKAQRPAIVHAPPPPTPVPARQALVERAPSAVYANEGNQVTLSCAGEQLFLDYIDGNGYANWQRTQRDKVAAYDRAQRLALSNQLAPVADGVLDSAFGIRFGAPFKVPGALPDILAGIHPPRPFVAWPNATYEIMLDQSAVPIRVAAHATFPDASAAYAEKTRLVAALTERYGQPLKDTQRHSVISTAGRLAVVDLIGTSQVLVMFIDSDRLQIQRMRFEQRRVDLAAENERQRQSERAGF